MNLYCSSKHTNWGFLAQFVFVTDNRCTFAISCLTKDKRNWNKSTLVQGNRSIYVSHFFRGVLNVHGSILPRYRGAAPIPYAILNGDNSTGITIMEVKPFQWVKSDSLKRLNKVILKMTTMTCTFLTCLVVVRKQSFLYHQSNSSCLRKKLVI